MIVRRFVYSPLLDAVVELGTIHETNRPGATYQDALGSWQHRPDEGTGAALRNAALERADRRVRAHRKLGDEKRWSE